MYWSLACEPNAVKNITQTEIYFLNQVLIFVDGVFYE